METGVGTQQQKHTYALSAMLRGIMFTAILFSPLLFGTIEASAATYSGGKGTYSSPYLIATSGDLLTLSQSSGDWSKYFKMIADINMGDATTFTPIGSASCYFTGVFNGNGHVIRNITISKSTTNKIGLFGCVSGSSATVKNLGLEDCSITGQYSVGGIAGYSSGTISRCYFADNAVTARGIAGGIVGYNEGDIDNCYVRGRVLSTGLYVEDTSSGSIAGGIVGYSTGSVTRCYATGYVSVNYDNGGGLVGRAKMYSVTYSYWNKATTGQNSEGSTSTDSSVQGKTTADMMKQSTYSSWDFSSIWTFVDSFNDGYPVLQVFLQTVPNLVGMTVDDAEAALSDAGLFVATETEVYSDTVPAGYVISQSPAADTCVLPGSSVSLVISKGSEGNVNRPPVLTPIGNQTVAEGATLTFTVSATDPDGDTLTYTASNLPKGATFDVSTCTFTWRPGYDASGNYTNVVFTVTDNGSPVQSDSESITISIGNVNRPPVLASIGNQAVVEGATLTFTVSATDPDGDAVTYSASNLPVGATFDPATRAFAWAPGYDAVGAYTGIVFTVSDGVLTASESVNITVVAEGQCPTPRAPSNVAASDGTYPDRVRVTWTAADGATAYQVYRDGWALSNWITSMSYDDTTAGAPTISNSGCTGKKTTYDYHDYQVVARTVCDSVSGLSPMDSGYIGDVTQKSLSSRATTICETYFPTGAAYSGSTFALRLTVAPESAGISRESVWGAISVAPTGAMERGGTWRPVVAGDNHDGWVIFTPTVMLESGEEITLAVGASLETGEEVPPVSHTFRIEEGVESAEPAVEETERVTGVSKQVPVYPVSPDTVFAERLLVQLPLPEACAGLSYDVMYYSSAAEHTGWYNAANVEGWLAEDPERVTDEDGVPCIQLELNHGGIVQIVPRTVSTSRSQSSDVGLFAGVCAVFGLLSSRKATALLVERQR